MTPHPWYIATSAITGSVTLVETLLAGERKVLRELKKLAV